MHREGLVCNNVERHITSCGDNEDVQMAVCGVFETQRWQMSDYVERFRDRPFYQQCLAVFDSLIERVSYHVDPIGEQLIKTPARLLHDGVGDCKSMTVYCASCMWSLGADVIIRFVSFTKDKNYTHVYCVVSNGSESYIMDPVERTKSNGYIFNYARPFVYKKDYKYRQ